MDYEEEISALKETVFVLLEADQRRRVEYNKIEKRYKEVVKTLLRKDEGFQELVTNYHTQQEQLKFQLERFNAQNVKLSELEDVLEEYIT